jgi:hypothetical protein
MANIISHQGNANKTTMRYHFMLTRMAIIKRQIATSIELDVEKSELSYTAGENIKWYSYSGK